MARKSQKSNLRKVSGFTLIEILVVIGILIFILLLAPLLNTGSITRESVISEQNTLVSVLERARSRAMNNVSHLPHGVHINSAEFVIFKGVVFTPGDVNNEVIERNVNVLIDTSDIGSSDVIFKQLRGNTQTSGDIVLTQGARTVTITIHNEGMIEW